MQTPSSSPIIELSHVTRLYKTVIGVNDLNVQLSVGSYGLVGPNGAGKSTLIGLLTGALKPTRGTVRVFGADPAEDRQVCQRMGVCPATELLLPRTPALDWVTELLMVSGYNFREARKRAKESLERTGIKDDMYRPIGSYSLGMRQRVKLAQAIAHDPQLLILDEPFNGLDPVGRFEMNELLRQWISNGKTLILASHVLPEVEAVTDAFLLIFGGRLLATGTTEELRSIVADLPQQVTVTGSDVARLAGRLANESWVESMQLSSDRGSLKIEARHAEQLLTALNRWIAEDSVNVTRMTGATGDLSSLFDILTRRHRGYAR